MEVGSPHQGGGGGQVRWGGGDCQTPGGEEKI